MVRLWSEICGTTLTWADLPWLRSLTKLPLLLKGICHPDDVRRAIDGGVDGIYCSTHGGRQAHGGIGCLDMLPAVVETAKKTPVLELKPIPSPLPAAFGCGGCFTAIVTTLGELDAALARAATGEPTCDIEVVAFRLMEIVHPGALNRGSHRSATGARRSDGRI